MRIVRLRKRKLTGVTGETYTAIAYWENLINPLNLNSICDSLGIKSPFLTDGGRNGSRKGYHIAPYMIYNSPETGVIFRLGVFKYEHELLGWGSDGCEDDVEYCDNSTFTSLIKDVMKALGLEYNEYPTSCESVALIEKLSKLDSDFRDIFDKTFEIVEISDCVHSLTIEEWKKIDKSQELNTLISKKENENNNLSSRLNDTAQYLQRVLIDRCFDSCVRLVMESREIDSNYLNKKADYENVLKDSSATKKRLAVLKNLFDGARLKYNNLHDKSIARIFGADASAIDYDYLKSYVLNKISE